MKEIGYLVSSVAIVIPVALWSGYVLSILWGWFVVGTFGLPQLSINAAIGLTIIVRSMTKTVDTKKRGRSTSKVLVDSVLLGALKPALALAVGWIVRLFA